MLLLEYKQSIIKLGLSILLSLVYLSSWTAQARVNSLGIGGMLGQPHGITIQVPVSHSTAFNSSLYYDILKPQIGVHLDQVFFSNSLIHRELYPYMGYGGRLSLQPHSLSQKPGMILARVPFGLEFGNHLRIFIELTPSLSVLPSLKFYLQSALGLRYHF